MGNSFVFYMKMEGIGKFSGKSESSFYSGSYLAPYASGYAFGFDPTSRCHKKEFLLKFAKDRHRWLEWLFEVKKRYGLVILNYVVTSNHIHLIVRRGCQNPNG